MQSEESKNIWEQTYQERSTAIENSSLYLNLLLFSAIYIMLIIHLFGI